MKEDMGKYKKIINRSSLHPVCPGVVQAVITLQKLEPGCTQETRLLLHYSGAKKSRFFCLHNTGGHAMKNTGSIPKSN